MTHNPTLPPLLYKFLPPRLGAEGPVSFLGADRLLRFTQSGSFNDPFECLPSWDLSAVDSQFIEQFLVGKTVIAAHLPFDQRRKFEARKRRFAKERLRNDPDSIRAMLTAQARRSADRVSGALSLSGTWNSSPMWAHYCANHRGLVVGLRTETSFFQQTPANLVFKVDYASERPRIAPSRIDDPGYIGRMFFGTKDARWAYENEFRLVRPWAHASKEVGKDGHGNPIYLFEVPKNVVAEVILGLHCDDAFVREVVRLTASLPDVRVFRVKIGLNSYDFDREEIDRIKFTGNTKSSR